jgi:hypothetical protein
MHLASLPCATCPAHLILLDCIMLISGEEFNYEVPDYEILLGFIVVLSS